MNNKPDQKLKKKLLFKIIIIKREKTDLLFFIKFVNF